MLPGQLRALPPGERAFVFAAIEVGQEEQSKPQRAPGTEPSGSGGKAGKPPAPSKARAFREDVLGE